MGDLVLNELRTAINNPLDFKNFYVFFVVAYLLLFIPLLIIATSLRNYSSCNSATMSLSENIPSRNGKIFEFTYSGKSSCIILVSPRWNRTKQLSMWLYNPDKSIESLEPTGNNLTFSKADRGTYRVSVHNDEDSSVNFQLKVSAVPK
ncbi:MAG: hypothetical protein A2Z11_04435 [Candidatus Woykebacteria bacterium RBG_16_43_9]|uniref:MSP domain-containing protein n=1 Tax=Candidatus Woykebacteria bacterium RBG_16_43_9 TaxID=1802596 RepID=A0A1G1WDF2_9BACT|nr:MAG: hypothetical protein A2Z11_04435 [Candidatus Woykebacteria bacterium RBG_16_43_9]